MENLNEQLIELVRANPCIYNKGDENYKNFHLKEKIWENIAMELNLSAKECKVKWKSLRDRYRREKNADDLPSGSSKKIGPVWKYLSSLDFLADSMDCATTSNNFCEELDDSTGEWLTDDSQSTPVKSTARKRKNDDLFVDVLMAMKKKYETTEVSSTPKYENFFGMLREKFDRLKQSEIDDVQLEILQIVNRKINSQQTTLS